MIAADQATSRRLAKAVKLHNRGNLEEAARAYEHLVAHAARAWEPRYLLGVLRFQQGEPAVAQRWLMDATRLNARHADGWFYLGESMAAQGYAQDAETAYAKASAQTPPHAMASFRLAALLEARGAWAESENAYRRALAGNPAFPEALNNLGRLLSATGRSDQAEPLLRQALHLRADFDAAYINLAGLLTARNLDPQASIDLLSAGIAACPGSADLHFHLAALLAAHGQRESAVAQYEQVLALNPNHASAYNNVGVLFLEEGFVDEARACFDRAIARDPELVEARNNLGNVFTQLEHYAAARTAFEGAIALRPGFADPYNGLGIVMNEQGAIDDAVEQFRSALQRKAEYPEAAANLGAALCRLGDLDGARQACRESLRMMHSVALQIKTACMVPPIVSSPEALLVCRERLECELDALIAANLRTTEQDLLKYPDGSFFYLAYHGMNDRTLRKKRAQLLAGCCPSLLYTAPGASQPRAEGGPIRIGFVSRFFHNHSVGNFFNPIIEYVAQLDGFEVSLFAVGFKQDEVLQHTAGVCHEYVPLSARSLQDARTAIEQRALDILVYTDIGMDPFTELLSFSRLAPTQCVLQGHSETSGVPNLDYFISSRIIEPPHAQEQYSERLLLLEELPMVLLAYPPLGELPSREELGLPTAGTLYVCPMKLHKIHPDMDRMISGILDKDLQGYVILFAEHGNPAWTALLRERLSRVVSASAVRRIVFLPFAADFARFRAIIAAAAVALDTPHHGGGTTINICISVGTPIISLVGDTCRGRAPFAFYAMMDLSDGIVATAEEYVEIAVSIANDSARRAALAAGIIARAPRILRNQQVLEAYRDLFKRLATGNTLPLSTPEHSSSLDAVSAGPVDAPAVVPPIASLAHAIALHQAGELAQAREIYLHFLHNEPACADAWHLLGVIAIQLLDLSAAILLIGHAIELDPNQAHYFNNLGNALFAAKKLDDSETMYRRAIALQRDYAEATYNLGNTLQILQRYDEALECYEQAVRLKPDYTDALFSAAGLFEARGEYAIARELYQRLLAMDPNYINAHLHLGRDLFVEGNVAEGTAHYLEYKREQRLKFPATKESVTKLLQLTSVKEWCARSGDRYEQVRPAIAQHVDAPRFSQPPALAVPPSDATLHELYLAAIRNATVISWHDIVLTDSEHTALYDLATRNPDDAIEVEHGAIRYASSTHLLMDACQTGELPVDHGVLIAGRGRDSFAHWVIDFLPRLWILDQFPEYDDWPLLIDAGLYPQQLESLQALNRTGRPLVVLNTDTEYKLERLVLLSDLSSMRRQTYRPFARPSGNEVTVSADALTYLRQAFAPDAELSPYGRRLYVSRRYQSQFRRMTNEPDVERLLASHGFEIIYPEQLTFAEQARLFSEARVLAGAGGSNMINSIFAPPGTRILLFTQWHPGINYYFFSHLAQLRGQHLEYVLGEVTQRHTFYYQNDFVVDLAKIEQALANLT